MLDIQVTLEGNELAISGLGDLRDKGVRRGIRRGLGQSVKEAHREALHFLSGPGRKPVRLRDRKEFRYQDGNVERRVRRKTKARGQFEMLGARPGSYPVPVLTGHLRRALGFVQPGKTVSVGGLSFRAGEMEAVLFDAAEYADVIEEGKFSSAKFGPRPFMTDGLKKVDIAGNLEREIGKETKI